MADTNILWLTPLSWNDENRLVEVKDAASGSTVMACAYDGQGRRRERVTHADGIATTNRYVYNGWAVLAVLAISKATLAGLHQIWGWVPKEDIIQTPYLLQWYEKRGFSISEPDDECPSHAVKKIVKQLKVAGNEHVS